MNNETHHLNELLKRYPSLESGKEDIMSAFRLIMKTVRSNGTILVCGNGGSAADSEHIVGELMKGFLRKRPLPDDLAKHIMEGDGERGPILAGELQVPIRAISLTGHISLTSAFNNDINAELNFAQQVLGYGRAGDTLLALSTSGNSANVVNAVYLASRLDIHTIGMTGQGGGRLADYCEVCIRVPEVSTPLIQELHLPVYHTLCSMVESSLFNE